MKESFKTVEWASTYTQEEDTGGRADCREQYITLSAVDNGNNENYLIIETERWAIDIDEIDKFCDVLKKFINQELVLKKKK
jgi:hypothetical protein